MALPYDSRDQRLHARRRVDEQPQHAARRLHRIVVRQPRRHAGLGQPAAARRLDERAGPRAHGAVAVELGADGQRRRLHEVRAAARSSPASSRSASGATTSRCSRSRSTRRCRRSTLPRATAEAEASVFSTNLNLVSRPATDWRFSARLRRYDYDNQTPHTASPQFINYDTSVNDVVHRRAGALRAQPHDLRRGRDVERASAAWP